MHRQTERLRTWKIEWLGACRKCSGFDGASHRRNSRTVNEYGYLWKTSVSGVALLDSVCILGGFLEYLQEKSAQKKPCSFLCPRSRRGVFSLVRLNSAVAACGFFLRQTSIQSPNQQQAQSIEVKGERRSSVTRRSSPIEIESTEREYGIDIHQTGVMMKVLLLMIMGIGIMWLDGWLFLHKNSTPEVGCILLCNLRRSGVNCISIQERIIDPVRRNLVLSRTLVRGGVLHLVE